VKRILLILLLAMSGCGSYEAIGTFDNYNEVMSDTVHANLLSGGGTFELIGKKSQFKCTGYAEPPSFIPSMMTCTGQRGRLHTDCDVSQKNLKDDETSVDTLTGVTYASDIRFHL
jgi:hypothetical protein